jgi:DNA-binding PadR family transcriptional regulator
MGLTPLTLFTTTLLIVRNQRILAAWNTRQERNARRAAKGLPPKTRRRRRTAVGGKSSMPSGFLPVIVCPQRGGPGERPPDTASRHPTTAMAHAGLAIARSMIYNVCMAVRAMQEATFMILTALANGSQHGYGIITDVREISGGRVRLRAGTLYMALDRLRADELIAVDREEVVDGRLRRYYRLTPAGTKLLADEAARLQAHATVALRRLDLAGGMAT